MSRKPYHSREHGSLRACHLPCCLVIAMPHASCNLRTVTIICCFPEHCLGLAPSSCVHSCSATDSKDELWQQPWGLYMTGTVWEEACCGPASFGGPLNLFVACRMAGKSTEAKPHRAMSKT